MTRLRHRIAHWLVGPFFELPGDGSWIVQREGEWVFGIRLTEWAGTMTTELEPLDYKSTEPVDFDRPRTHGSFTGTYSA